MSQDTSIQSNESTKRKAIRRPLLVGGIIAAIGLLVIIWLRFEGPTSDEQMIANFHAKRDTFEQLRQMVNDDVERGTLEMHIDVNGGHQSFRGSDISEARYQDYQVLLRKVGMAAIGSGSYQGEPPSGSLTIPSPVIPFMVPTKGYLFTPSQPTWSTITTGDTGSDLFPLGKEICRPLEEQWYICVDARETVDESVVLIPCLFILAIITPLLVRAVLLRQT